VVNTKNNNQIILRRRKRYDMEEKFISLKLIKLSSINKVED
jgi:hypothetical protein